MEGACVVYAADPTSRYNGFKDEALVEWASGARAERSKGEVAARRRGRLSSVMARLSAARISRRRDVRVLEVKDDGDVVAEI